MLRKIVARQILLKAIRIHETERWLIVHSTGYPGVDIDWHKYVESTPDYIWHQASAEYRCAERIKKLLSKYQ